MDKRVRGWLVDIIKSISEINSFLPAEPNFIEFQKDLKTRKAVERNLEIIGEAVNRIKKADGSFHIQNSSRIVALETE